MSSDVQEQRNEELSTACNVLLKYNLDMPASEAFRIVEDLIKLRKKARAVIDEIDNGDMTGTAFLQKTNALRKELEK